MQEVLDSLNSESTHPSTGRHHAVKAFESQRCVSPDAAVDRDRLGPASWDSALQGLLVMLGPRDGEGRASWLPW
jgi:hypothetical protein